MARKKPPLSLRRPADVVDPQQAERFVRGAAPPPEPPAVRTSKHLDVQTSERPDRAAVQEPGARSRTRAPSRSLVYRKRTDDHRRRMTIYLPEELSRRLRLYAAERDQDYSDVLAEALLALLDRKGVRPDA